MNPLEPRVTRRRILAGAAIFVVATVLLYFSGIDLGAYLLGVALGVAALLLLVGGLHWLRRDAPPPPRS